MPNLDEHDDPEASYRRGYQQGAYAALEAVGRLTTDKLRHWVDVTLFKWRYHDRPHDRSVPPPPANQLYLLAARVPDQKMIAAHRCSDSATQIAIRPQDRRETGRQAGAMGPQSALAQVSLRQWFKPGLAAHRSKPQEFSFGGEEKGALGQRRS